MSQHLTQAEILEITGRDWWHYALYCPALASIDRQLTVHEIKRDPEYIAALEADLLAFDALVESYRDKLTNSARGDDPREALETQPERAA